MKALGIIAAAVVGFFTVPTAANAYVLHPATPPAIALVSHVDLIQRWDDRRDDRRYDRGRGYDRRHWDRGRHRRWRWRTACHTQWRGRHRERVCRRIRYR